MLPRTPWETAPSQRERPFAHNNHPQQPHWTVAQDTHLMRHMDADSGLQDHRNFALETNFGKE